MLQGWLHPKIVSERLGHSTHRDGLDTYSYVTRTMQQQAAPSTRCSSGPWERLNSQRSRKGLVLGSESSGADSFCRRGGVSERLKEAVLKTVVAQATVGSNPTPSARLSNRQRLARSGDGSPSAV